MLHQHPLQIYIIEKFWIKP